MREDSTHNEFHETKVLYIDKKDNKFQIWMGDFHFLFSCHTLDARTQLVKGSLTVAEDPKLELLS